MINFLLTETMKRITKATNLKFVRSIKTIQSSFNYSSKYMNVDSKNPSLGSSLEQIHATNKFCIVKYFPE